MHLITVIQLLPAFLAPTALSAPSRPGRTLSDSEQSLRLGVQDPSRLTTQPPRKPADRSSRQVEAAAEEEAHAATGRFDRWLKGMAYAKDARLRDASCFCAGGSICCREESVGGLSCNLGNCSM